jgi:hypothetical protein
MQGMRARVRKNSEVNDTSENIRPYFNYFYTHNGYDKRDWDTSFSTTEPPLCSSKAVVAIISFLPPHLCFIENSELSNLDSVYVGLHLLRNIDGEFHSEEYQKGNDCLQNNMNTSWDSEEEPTPWRNADRRIIDKKTLTSLNEARDAQRKLACSHSLSDYKRGEHVVLYVCEDNDKALRSLGKEFENTNIKLFVLIGHGRPCSIGTDISTKTVFDSLLKKNISLQGILMLSCHGVYVCSLKLLKIDILIIEIIVNNDFRWRWN